RYSEVESVTLVDLDPVMTQLFATHPLLTALNGGALTSPKLHIVNADAFVWLDAAGELYDFVIVDFPDPSSYNLGKLYTTAFYRLAAKHLSRAGLMVVQSTSPLFAPRSFWCIARTIADAGLRTYPYHVYVPSFGEWGFVLAGLRRYEAPPRLPHAGASCARTARHCRGRYRRALGRLAARQARVPRLCDCGDGAARRWERALGRERGHRVPLGRALCAGPRPLGGARPGAFRGARQPPRRAVGGALSLLRSAGAPVPARRMAGRSGADDRPRHARPGGAAPLRRTDGRVPRHRPIHDPDGPRGRGRRVSARPRVHG